MPIADTLEFKFSTALTEPPANQEIRLDALDPLQATKLWIDYNTNDGTDAYYGITAIPAGAQLYVQDKNDHTQHAKFETTATAVDRTGYFEIAVAPIESTGAALINNQIVLLILPYAAPAHPPLVTLAQMKAELRVTHAEEDDVILRKIDEAESLVLDYLKIDEPSPFAPAVPWDTTTVPRVIRAAIIQTVVDLYSHRGEDDPEPTATADADAWPSPRVKGWLRRWRDPAYA